MTFAAMVLARVAVLLLLIATLLPLFPVGAWTVRLFDFPRAQIAVLILLVLAWLCVWGVAGGWSPERSLLSAACVAMLLWQVSHIVPYMQVWPDEIPTACEPTGDPLTLAVANVEFKNSQHEQVLQQAESLKADLLLVIEVSEPWDDALRALDQHYAHRKGVVRGEGLGMVLWSNLPAIKSEVRYLVSERRASIWAEYRLPDGRPLRFVGVHPTPPGLEQHNGDGRYDSRIRDAELMLVAKEIAESPDDLWVVTGDFNDVAWSHTTRLFKRMSGLQDPRVGRGLYNTYHAAYPGLRFPIDHVFLTPAARMLAMDRFRPAGSDHLGIVAQFCFNGGEAPEPEPEGNDPEDAEAMIEEGEQDAEKNGESVP